VLIYRSHMHFLRSHNPTEDGKSGSVADAFVEHHDDHDDGVEQEGSRSREMDTEDGDGEERQSKRLRENLESSASA
jgi:hypothetical protein